MTDGKLEKTRSHTNTLCRRESALRVSVDSRQLQLNLDLPLGYAALLLHFLSL